MSSYTTYYRARQCMYKQLAVRWKAWADESELTENQVRGMCMFFRHIGRRFGLLGEFKDIGVI